MIFNIPSHKMRLFAILTVHYIMLKRQCFLYFEKQICILAFIYNVGCVGDISYLSAPVKLKPGVASKKYWI
jgi:hypothetical protein